MDVRRITSTLQYLLHAGMHSRIRMLVKIEIYSRVMFSVRDLNCEHLRQELEVCTRECLKNCMIFHLSCLKISARQGNSSTFEIHIDNHSNGLNRAFLLSFRGFPVSIMLLYTSAHHSPFRPVATPRVITDLLSSSQTWHLQRRH